MKKTDYEKMPKDDVQDNTCLEDFTLQEEESQTNRRIETLAFKETKKKPSRFSHCPYEMHLRKNATHKPRIKL